VYVLHGLLTQVCYFEMARSVSVVIEWREIMVRF
jgi:hypothetical protein